MLGYCAELGVPVEIFVDATDANYFYEENPELGPLSGRNVRLREVKADLWGSTAELLTKAMDQGRIDAPLSTDDKERLVSFLLRAGYSSTEDHVYRPPTSRGSQDRHDLSGPLLQTGFGSRVRSLYAGTGGPAPVCQPVGGMMEIPLAFQRAMGDRITLGAEIQSIRQTADGVRVVHRNAGPGKSGRKRPITASAVFRWRYCNVSTSPCRPRWPRRSTPPGTKPPRRWGANGSALLGGGRGDLRRAPLVPEFAGRRIVLPIQTLLFEEGGPARFLRKRRLAGLSDVSIEARVRHVITQASKVHPQMREALESAFAVWWEKFPYSLGAYGRTPAPRLLAQLSKPDGRFYLGCAGVSQRPAWIEGGIHAAWRTVEALHECAMRA